jgi:glutamine amidotransferase
MIGIIDYGVGNLFSLRSSLQHIGADVEMVGDAAAAARADRLILPGVGAFRDAAAALDSAGLGEVVKAEAAAGKPLMGICLGMQLLFERSFEYGEYEGLGLIPGDIVPIRGAVPDSLKVPQIGWNGLEIKKESPLLAGIDNGDCVYFVHSYYAKTPDEYVLATTEYGADLTAAVQNGNVYGCQFHPEKSADVGLRILRNFCGL